LSKFTKSKDGEGFIRFCSPESQENEIASSIILGPDHEVLDAKVGMQFSEIIDQTLALMTSIIWTTIMEKSIIKSQIFLLVLLLFH
jgi:hypothetical protein